MEAKDFLPYYDVEEGLGRLRGNKMLLSRLIKGFAATLSLDEFKQAYEEKRVQDAQAIIHTLKGASANLSMNGVFHLCREVEAILKESGDISIKLNELDECVTKTKQITPDLIEYLAK